jgi:glycosyltransferase involved in cell wall biosynthesis
MTNKILFVSKDASWQRYRNEVLLYLTDTYDCNVDVITEGEIKNYIKPSDKLKYLCRPNILRNYKGFNFLPSAYSYIVKNKPDVVLALPNATNLTELTLAIFCKLTNTKLVYWTHGYDHCRRPEKGFSGFVNKFRVFLINSCIRQADSVITFSKPGKDYLISQGVSDENIYVAPNTLNTDKLIESYVPITSNKVDSFKTENNINDKIIYLFSGRFRRGKRLENFIKALGKSKNKDSVALVIVGDGEMRADWEALCKESNVNALFLGEIFDENRLAVIFKSADWFVMPGYVGLAIVHAFSAGLPLLSENISFHSPEITFLKQNLNGILFKENDLNAWVSFIEEQGNDPILRNKMSQEALQTVNNEANIRNQLYSMSLALGLTKNV